MRLIASVRRGIARLIDAYQDGYLERTNVSHESMPRRSDLQSWNPRRKPSSTARQRSTNCRRRSISYSRLLLAFGMD